MSSFSFTESDGNGGRRINLNWAALLVPFATAALTFAMFWGAFGVKLDRVQKDVATLAESMSEENREIRSRLREVEMWKAEQRGRMERRQ